MEKLNEKQKDVLKEMASIISGNASTVLSNLTGNEIKVTIPNVKIAQLKELPKEVGGPKKMVVGVYTPLKGDISGSMVLVFPTVSALILSDLLTKRELGITEMLRKEEQELLKKAGNAMSTAYINVLKDFLKIKITRLDTRFISTFGENISDFILLGVREKVKYALFLGTVFSLGPPRIEGRFVVVLPIESIDHLLELINNKLKELYPVEKEKMGEENDN